MKDFFISYNRADKQWAEWIAWQLEEASYTTIIQAWDFRPGGNFAVDMQKATVEAQRTIAVLSQNYLDAIFTQPEWTAAFAQDPTGEKRILLPVRVKECELKGMLAQIVYVDLIGLPEDAAREMLLIGLKEGRIKPFTPPPFPGDKVIPSLLRSEKPAFPGSSTIILVPDEDFLLIPAGPFLMGSLESQYAQSEELPQHLVDLANYRIGKYPVTNVQYAEFVKQTKHPAPQKGDWFGKTPAKDKLDHPVVGVSWYDAQVYCRWLSKQTGRIYRLPTEAEWEKAARGTDGRLYPWGNEWNISRCNCAASQTTPVTAYPAGQSPYGCYDMIGNVWEWTSTLWGTNWRESEFPYPYQPDDGREDSTADSTCHRLFRGGCFDEEITHLRCSARRWYAPDHRDKRRGFRVALAMEQ